MSEMKWHLMYCVNPQFAADFKIFAGIKKLFKRKRNNSFRAKARKEEE